jgi:type VI secretion system protein ImpF
MRECVLRDLRWLLNARIGSLPSYHREVDDQTDPLHETVLRLGLPDITTLDLKNTRQSEYLRRRIVDTITLFEPRLDFVTVSIEQEGDGRGRTRFHVDARLHVDPEPLKLSFDATVVWRNRTVEVG